MAHNARFAGTYVTFN